MPIIKIIPRIDVDRYVRNYDEAKDSKESCSICLIEFSEDNQDKVAELNCSNTSFPCTSKTFKLVVFSHS